MKNILCLNLDVNNTIENIDYLIQEYLPSASETSLLLFGKQEDINKLNAASLSQYYRKIICLLPSLIDDDIRLVVLAYMASCSESRVNVISIINNDIFVEIYPDDLSNTNTPYLFFKLLECIVTTSRGWLYQNTDCHLKDLKELSNCIHDKSLSSNLNEIAVILRNVLSVECEFIFGNDTNDVSVISAYTQKNQFEKNNLLSLVPKYSVIYSKYKNHLPGVDFRNQQLNLLKQLSDDVIIGRHKAELMYWYSSYFMMMATYFKKNSAYYTGVLFIIRALECALQGTCFKHGAGSFGRYGKFELNGVPCSGIGELIRYVSQNYLTSQENIKHNVNDIIDIRNNSMIGHGYSYLNKETYDHCYIKLRSLINCLASKAFVNSDHWYTLASYSQSNFLKELGVVIGKNTLSNVIRDA